MQAIIKRVHAISPCARDIQGPYEIRLSDLETVENARAWLKKHGVTGLGRYKQARLLKDRNGWVFFPPQTTLNRTGSVWWSISIRLDVKDIQQAAANCTCRNHPIKRSTR